MASTASAPVGKVVTIEFLDEMEKHKKRRREHQRHLWLSLGISAAALAIAGFTYPLYPVIAIASSVVGFSIRHAYGEYRKAQSHNEWLIEKNC